MGIIRGGIVFFLGILLLGILIVGNFFLVVSSSLEYENVQPQLSSSIQEFLEKDNSLNVELGNIYSGMELYCSLEGNEEYIFVYQDFDFPIELNIPCEAVSEGLDSVLKYGSENLVEKIYYADYDCGFFGCFKEGKTFFLISDYARNYCKTRFYYFLFFSFILAGGIFFFIEKKINLFFVLGFLLILSSLPFMKLNWFFDSVGSLSLEYFSELFSLFFATSYSIFLAVFIIGFIFILFGVGFKFWDFEKKIFSFFNKGEKIPETNKKKN